MSRLWDRGEPLDQVVARFTVGRDPELDQRLLPFDALASAAHACGLEAIGVIDAAQRVRLVAELELIAAEARAGTFRIAPEEEDGHTAIENRLTARLGDLGRRIHTGRSRNDQVIAALRLWAREAVLELGAQVLEVMDLLIGLAEKHREVSVPGYSHTRQAMPSTIGFLFAAHAELLGDDLPWLQTALDHLDRSPLGSASGFGVPLPLPRQQVADLLAFRAVQVNTLAVQNDRGKTEWLVLSAAAAPALDLARLAADLICYSSDELRFVELGHEVTTGSSIMPHKRNPDVLELIRGGAARLRARQAEVGAVLAGLSSGYHRDLQLTKEPFLDGMQTAIDLAAAMRPALETLEVDAERCRAAVLRATAATDAVYARVARGVPFRTAYKEVAAAPEAAVEGDASEAWRSRTHLGAPGALDLGPARAALATGRDWLQENRRRLDGVWRLLAGS